MNYQILPPHVQLSDLVQCFWALESTPGEAIPGEYFLMADNCLEFIFQYGGGFRSYAAESTRVRFQYSICDKFSVGEKIGFFGVRLYPHAVSHLLGIPAGEVVNLVLDFATLFKQEGQNISDRMYNASNTDERVALISQFLARGAWLNKKTDPVNHFVRTMIDGEDQMDISRMWQSSGLSIKQFERRFKAITGFPPKYFARICRFQSVKNKYNANRRERMTDLAYLCDYYDQSHFNREFMEFSGIRPLNYFRPADNSGDTRLPCGWFV
jgi:AraC-like DNA-binding protein